MSVRSRFHFEGVEVVFVWRWFLRVEAEGGVVVAARDRVPVAVEHAARQLGEPATPARVLVVSHVGRPHAGAAPALRPQTSGYAQSFLNQKNRTDELF